MGLVKKLEKRAKELDMQIKHSLSGIGPYNPQAYDDRELMEQAARVIRGVESPFRIVHTYEQLHDSR